MPDRGFRNDMKVLSIICSICDTNLLFKDYEVRSFSTNIWIALIKGTRVKFSYSTDL